MTNAAPKQTDDEIDLFELFQTIWRGRWLVIGVIAFSLGLAFAYLKVTPNKFTAELSLSPNTNIESELSVVKFNLLNNIGLSNSYFMSTLSSQLQKTSVKSAAFDKYNASKTSQDNLDAIGELSTHAKNESISLQLKSNNQFDLDAFFETLISIGIEKVKTELKSASEKAFDKKVIEVAAVIEAKLSEITFEQLINTNRIATEIDQLELQAQIARTLEVPYPSDIWITGDVISIKPYLLGYKAIDAEIAVLTASLEDDPNQSNYNFQLKQEVQLLEKEINPKHRDDIRAALDQVINEDFKFVDYDLATISIKMEKKPALILALSSVLGAFLGVLIVLLKSAVATRRSQDAL